MRAPRRGAAELSQARAQLDTIAEQLQAFEARVSSSLSSRRVPQRSNREVPENRLLARVASQHRISADYVAEVVHRPRRRDSTAARPARAGSRRRAQGGASPRASGVCGALPKGAWAEINHMRARHGPAARGAGAGRVHDAAPDRSAMLGDPLDYERREEIAVNARAGSPSTPPTSTSCSNA